MSAPPPNDSATSNWAARPWVARVIRTFVFLAPLVVSVVVAWLLSGLIPTANSLSTGVVRWLVIAAVSTVVLMGVDKLARRLLPLATLYGLTLAFPDQAPSRFKMALRTGSTSQLRTRIDEAKQGKPTDTPAAAAERVLELVIALSAHDRLTRGHSERVRAYTQMIGEEMGLTSVELDRLRWSGLLHDIGKLRIDGEILNKTSRLTDEEFEQIKSHPNHGRDLVTPLIPWLGESARAVWEHHERWDGRGYPNGLAGSEISLAGRIVAVADVFDVITSVRSYKQAGSPVDARAELTRCSGTQFDPVVVRAFMNVSLGRLRLAMGPLSWLAQVPLFPQAITATAATGTAGAATALVGAAAASLGLGLAGDQIDPTPAPVVAESAAVGTFEDAAGLELIGPDDPQPSTAPHASPEAEIAPELVADGSAPPTPASTPSESSTPSPTSPTEDTQLEPGAPSSTGPSPPQSNTTTTQPRRTPEDAPVVNLPGSTPTTRPPSTPTPANPSPTTRPPTPTTVATTQPPATTAAPTTPAPTTAPTTTPATTAAPTTTLPPRPAWLPPAGQATAFYLDVPGSVVLAQRPLLPLSRTAPSSGTVTDPEGDGRAGITLGRTPANGVVPANGEVAWALGDPSSSVRVTGNASGTIYVNSTSLIAINVRVRARLLACDQAGACTVVSERTEATLVALFNVAVAYDFGAIDVTIPPNGTLRLVLDVPNASSGDAVISADASGSPSRINLTFA